MRRSWLTLKQKCFQFILESHEKVHVLSWAIFNQAVIYKPWAKSMGEGDFRPSPLPTAPTPLDRFSWNLKYITISRIWPRMQNIRGLCQRGWSGQIASLTHESVCLFHLSSSRPQIALLHTYPLTIHHNMSLPRAPFWGLKRWNSKLYPNYPNPIA